jgi:hypothetical protein
MLWNPIDHSDQENLRWSWLRAIEWGRWPIFLSQSIAPLILIWIAWYAVVIGLIAINILWAIFIKYRFVSVDIAFIGKIFVAFKWIIWPVSTIYLFITGRTPECWIAAFWPLLIVIIGAIPTTKVGVIQGHLMKELGYEPTDINPLSGSR